jgi:crotonobetainyl-CoA:carnitine CoA-transferase CaiB-like acyl-CoA transferase
VTIPGFPFKLSAQPDLLELTAPLLGEHNDEVLGDLLGYSSAQLEDLVAGGVLFSSDR